MAGFRVSNLTNTSADVHVKSKTAHVFKRGNYWIVKINDTEAAFLECEGHEHQDICPDPTLSCIRGEDPRHIIDYCHRMHGPRAINMAASMLGGVEFKGNPAEQIFRDRPRDERRYSPRVRRGPQNYYAPAPTPPIQTPQEEQRKKRRWFPFGSRDADA